jgi:hypothetical protein
MSKKPVIIVKPSKENRSKENPVSEEVQLTGIEEVGRSEQPDDNLHQESSLPADSKTADSTILDSAENSSSEQSSWPAIPGFDLDTANRNAQYVVRGAIILADCSVQQDQEGVFDVIARNFANVGVLAWWLGRMGKGHLVKFAKGKDMVDAVRKIAGELHRELKGEIGRPKARW